MPLPDGRIVDITSGELVHMVATVKTHPLRVGHERKIRRRLVTGGRKVAIECDHLERTEKRLEAIEAALAFDAMLDVLDGDWDAALNREQMIEAQRFPRRYIASRKRAGGSKGRTSDRRRPVNRRWQLSSLVCLDTGFTFLTNDRPALAVAVARAIHRPDQEKHHGHRANPDHSPSETGRRHR